MRFISNLCWVKKGASKTPTRIKLDKKEMKDLFSDLGRPNMDENEEEPEDQDENEDIEETNENSRDETETEKSRKINKKYNMDDYDDEGKHIWEYFNKM